MTPESRKRCRLGGFTLVELMVVVAVIALLAAMVIPSLSTATESARMVRCAANLHAIGSAMAQYLASNQNHLMPYSNRDQKAYNVLPCGVDGNGNPYDLRYGSWYMWANLLAPALGLGDRMPVEDVSGNWWPVWDRWAKACYCGEKPLQCAAGTKNITSPYGWACDPKNGGGVSCFYSLNVSWTSQTERISGSAWPARSAYFPLFKDAAQAVILYENWTCNGMQPDNCLLGQPYSTHFRAGSAGAEGLGRNILYADWSIKRTPPSSASLSKPFMLWGQYDAIQRGSDMGLYFKGPWDGKSYVGWTILNDLLTKG